MHLNYRQDFNAGLQHYQDALQYKPTHAQANCNIAVIYHHTGRQAEAEEQFRRTIQMQPLFMDCRRSFANFLSSDGREQEANHIVMEGQQIGALDQF